MKRAIVVAATVLLANTVFAVECERVDSHKVSQISYKMRSAEDSLHRMLRGTPYKGVFEIRANETVKARRLSGPLSRSLDLLASQTGTSWRQEGCQLRFFNKQAAVLTPTMVASTPKVASVSTSGAAAVPSAVWALKADVPIHLQFADWARQAGWQFEWRLDKSWRVPAATQFTGSFDQALSEAVEGLYAQGKPVRLIIWEGNRFAEIVDVDAK